MKKRFLLLIVVLSIVFGCIPMNALAQENLHELVSKSVVRIVNEVNGGISRGTGFFINENQIVTNHHVVSPYIKQVGDKDWFEIVENRTVLVYYSEMSGDAILGTVVADWPEVDLAVVQVQKEYAKRVPIQLADPSDIYPGMDIWTAGFPGVNADRDNISSMEMSIYKGIITKITPTAHLGENSTPYVELSVDATINAGASGGPIVDQYGHVVGINNLGWFDEDANQAWFGVQVNELITRLDNRGFSYTKANATSGQGGLPLIIKGNGSGDDIVATDSATVEPVPPTPPTKAEFPWIWVVIGVLGAAVIAMLIVLLTGRKKTTPTLPIPTPSSKASIQGMSGQFQGIKKTLSKDKDCTFGKDEKCSIRFSGNDASKISRNHCRIHFSNTHQRYIVQDLGSTNGTVIVRGSQKKQVPKDSAIALRNGDLILIVDKNNSFKVNL